MDAEARYYVARTYAALGEPDLAMQDLTEAVEGGFACHTAFARDPWLEALRGDPRFTRLTASARDRSTRAAAAFTEAGGHRILVA